MSDFSEHYIQQIETLKEITNKSERDSLLFDLVMNFCMEEHHIYNNEDRALFENILARLMSNLDISKKIAIAEQIATSHEAPIKVVLYLALEPIEVAESILIHSPILSDDDLLVVIRIRGNKHMIAIATRENLSAKVSAALVKVGDETVWVPLIENNNATISTKSFRQLSEHASDSEVVFVTLLSRPDIPDYILRKIILDGGEEIRPFLMSGGLMHLAAILDEELARHNKTKIQDTNWAELRAIQNKLLKRKSADEFHECDFQSVIAGNDFKKIVCGFSLITGAPLEQAHELLSSRNFKPVILAIRATGMMRDTLEALLDAEPWKTTIAPESRRHFLHGYDKLKLSTARAVFEMRLKLFAAESGQRSLAL